MHQKNVVQINKTRSCHVVDKNIVEKFSMFTRWSLHFLTHLAKLSLYSNVVLSGQQQENCTNMTAAWLSSPGPWHLNTAQRYT